MAIGIALDPDRDTGNGRVRADDAAHAADMRDGPAVPSASVAGPQTTVRVGPEKIEADQAGATDLYIAELLKIIDQYRNSTSWKITAPLRALARRYPWISKNSRHLMKCAWLLGTCQVGAILDGALRRGVDHAPSGPGVSYNAWSIHRKPLALVVDSVYPRQDRDSGSVDTLHYVRMLNEYGYHIAFLAASEFSDPSPYRSRLESLGVEIVGPPHHRSINRFLTELGPHVELCLLCRVHSGGRYIELVRQLCSQAKVIFNTVDLHHLREEREALVTGDRRALDIATRTRRREISVARQADATIVVSREEHKLLSAAALDTPVHVVPLIRDAPGRDKKGFTARRGIAFLGGYRHRPNVDAVHYFLDEIWPLIRARLPDVEFAALGADLPADLADRCDPGFLPRGYVRDLREQLGNMRVMVAPLRYGAGAKGKVVTSLAHGVPCVASPMAAEGMGLVHGDTILIGDTARAFADHVVRLYTDETYWTRLSDQGIARMLQEHSVAAGKRRLQTILTDIKAPVPAGHVAARSLPHLNTV